MSDPEIQEADVVWGRTTPCIEFGETLDPSGERLERFQQAARDAITRIEEGFDRHLDFHSIAEELDQIIGEMWKQGWNPNQGNLNLFATDFGLALSLAILLAWNGELVFRSGQDIRHLSIWWPAVRLEAFPFHRVFRRLRQPDGQALAFFVASLSHVIKGSGLDSSAN